MSKTKILTEGALMLVLGIVLSFITPFQKLLPFGGSITLVSMLPICMFSIRHGVKKGLCLSFLFALFQLATGIIKDGLLAWGLTAGMLTRVFSLTISLHILYWGLQEYSGTRTDQDG